MIKVEEDDEGVVDTDDVILKTQRLMADVKSKTALLEDKPMTFNVPISRVKEGLRYLVADSRIILTSPKHQTPFVVFSVLRYKKESPNMKKTEGVGDVLLADSTGKVVKRSIAGDEAGVDNMALAFEKPVVEITPGGSGKNQVKKSHQLIKQLGVYLTKKKTISYGYFLHSHTLHSSMHQKGRDNNGEMLGAGLGESGGGGGGGAGGRDSWDLGGKLGGNMSGTDQRKNMSSGLGGGGTNNTPGTSIGGGGSEHDGGGDLKNVSVDNLDEYDPTLLDDPELRSGKHRTVLTLPSYMVSLIQYVKPSELKKDLNEQFKEIHPDVDITLSKLRSLKKDMFEIGIKLCDVDLSTVAVAFVYFEKLILNGTLKKHNRKYIAANCLVLATKFHNPPYEMNELYEAIEKLFNLPSSEFLKYEFLTFAALEFDLNVKAKDVKPHVSVLFQLYPDVDMSNYPVTQHQFVEEFPE
eukprot:Nk52_evm83s2118 gene=Nk52_evmTU83s2118